MIKFIKYSFVGGIATVVDMGVLFLATKLGLYYILSSVLGFTFGLITNFILSKKLVFTEKAKVGKTGEFLGYAAVGIVGLIITVILMYLFTDIFHLYFMFSKVITTLIVLLWNYYGRQCLYEKGEKNEFQNK